MSTVDAPDVTEEMGYWWLPSRPDNKVPGTIRYGFSIDPELVLLGVLREGDESRLIFGSGEEDLPEIICGITRSGNECTLVDCQISQRKHSGAGCAESYLAGMLIEGRCVTAKNDLVLHQMTAHFDYLTEWYGRTGRSSRQGAFPSVSIQIQMPQPNLADYGEGTLKLGIESQLNKPRLGGELVHAENAAMTIVPSTPQLLPDFLNDSLFPFICFVSLGTGRAHTFKRLSGKFAVDCRDKVGEELKLVPSSRFFWKQKRVDTQRRELVPPHMIFAFSHVEKALDEFLAKWYATYSKYRAILDLFFGRVQDTGFINSNTLLNVIQVVEGLHQIGRPERKISLDSNERQIAASILEVCPEQYKQWLERRIMRSRGMYLIDRIDDLLFEHAGVLGLCEDFRKHLAKRAKDMRNYYTHYSDNSLNMASAEDLYIFTNLFRYLVVACLLEEIGFSRVQAHGLLVNCRYFTTFIERHLSPMQIAFYDGGTSSKLDEDSEDD